MADLGEYDETAAPVSFDPVPPGKYVAIIVESDVNKTKSGTGDILTLEWRIAEGPYEGKPIFDRINVRNANPTAQKIGQGQLAALRAATGLNAPKQSEEFHNIPVQISVKIRPAGADKNGVHREAQNEVTGYVKVGSGAGSPPPTPPAADRQRTPSPTHAPTSPGRKPWERNAA